MIEQLKEYIKVQELFQPEEKVLLTVSGGIDSMTMLDLFIRCGYNFSIAHCNFQLRGEEADGDQKLLEDFAKEKNIELFVARFNTKEYSEKHKISIQMAARELRYNWFNELAVEHGFSKIATAHNLNDVVETFLINLTRGAGIKGLTGIKPINGNIVRPLLFAKRTEIEFYAKQNNVRYRNDSSNAETKYMRNAIRHKIIPEFEKLNPAYLDTVVHTADLLKTAGSVYDEHLKRISTQLIEKKGDKTLVNIEKLVAHEITPPVLFDFISEYGFNYEHAKGILQAIDTQPGKVFLSSTHQLVVDRTQIIIGIIEDETNQVYYLNKDDKIITKPVNLHCESIENSKTFVPVKSNLTGTFDADKLQFPLKLRRWEKGDYFYPFGMRGKKKLSDFFTDRKLSVIDKQEVWVMESGNEIIWIVGHRSDDRFKVSKTTKHILQIELK